VVIDAFRLINPQTMMLGQEPRQTTSNLGHLEKPSIQVRAPASRPHAVHKLLGCSLLRHAPQAGSTDAQAGTLLSCTCRLWPCASPASQSV